MLKHERTIKNADLDTRENVGFDKVLQTKRQNGVNWQIMSQNYQRLMNAQKNSKKSKEVEDDHTYSEEQR